VGDRLGRPCVGGCSDELRQRYMRLLFDGHALPLMSFDGRSVPHRVDDIDRRVWGNGTEGLRPTGPHVT
jgi:hypothetical protein